MLSRKDRENLHLATSNLRFWNDVTELHKPSKPSELLQIGNCGSPLETGCRSCRRSYGAPRLNAHWRPCGAQFNGGLHPPVREAVPIASGVLRLY
jgi:hypothetical protein